MSENGRERVERMHPEAVQHPRQTEQVSEQIEAMFREALERQRQRHEGALVEPLPRQAAERPDAESPPADESLRGVHYTELPEAKPGDPLAVEWNTYRRQVGRWLTEGLEGRFVHIKGEEIIGFYPTFEEAEEAGLKRCLLQPFFVHPIRTEEPYRRMRGINYPWPASCLP